MFLIKKISSYVSHFVLISFCFIHISDECKRVSERVILVPVKSNTLHQPDLYHSLSLAQITRKRISSFFSFHFIFRVIIILLLYYSGTLSQHTHQNLCSPYVFYTLVQIYRVFLCAFNLILQHLFWEQKLINFVNIAVDVCRNNFSCDVLTFGIFTEYILISFYVCVEFSVLVREAILCNACPFPRCGYETIKFSFRRHNCRKLSRCNFPPRAARELSRNSHIWTRAQPLRL